MHGAFGKARTELHLLWRKVNAPAGLELTG
jgi:hypothetical protein